MNSVNRPLDSSEIKFLTGPLAGRIIQLNKPIMTIGRDSTNDVVVKGDLKVSRHHARFVWNNGSWNIEKLSQTSTVTVNQRSVQQAVLQDNTTIGLGEDTTLLFLVQAGVQSSPQPSAVTPPSLTPPPSQPFAP